MTRRTNAISPPGWAPVRSRVTIANFNLIREFAHDDKDFPVALGDLSHRPKALVQGGYVKEHFKGKPGQAMWYGTGFVGVLRPDEAIIFDIKGEPEPYWPSSQFTDMTEGLALLCVYGAKSDEIANRLFAIDLQPYDKNEPFFVVTKYGEIKVWVLKPLRSEKGFFLLCVRSHAQNLYDACLDVGKKIGIIPVGLSEVENWIEKLGF